MRLASAEVQYYLQDCIKEKDRLLSLTYLVTCTSFNKDFMSTINSGWIPFLLIFVAVTATQRNSPVRKGLVFMLTKCTVSSDLSNIVPLSLSLINGNFTSLYT